MYKFEWISALVIGGLAATYYLSPKHETAEPVAWSATASGPQFERAEIWDRFGPVRRPEVEAAVRKHLRDPESAQFSNIYLVGDMKVGESYPVIACGHVNSKNGFGGYAGEVPFVVIPATGEVALASRSSTPDYNKVVGRYNALCGSKRSK